MELSEEFDVSKKCFKIKHQLFDSLNILYNISSSVMVLWNKFQIFVYEDSDFEDTSKIIVPEFQVYHLLMSNNYLVCLDCCGNVHTTSMKFKNPAQKRFKSSFQPRLQAVVACSQIQDNVLSLKYENDAYFLYLNKINTEFQLVNKIKVHSNYCWPLLSPEQEKHILTSHKLTTEELTHVVKIFDVKPTMLSDNYLIVLSFDKLTVSSCLISSKGNDVTLIKVYSCPSEICNIDIVNHDGLNIVIGLKMGTLIRLSLKDNIKKTDVVHLNKALHRYKIINKAIVYTDGMSTWKASNIFEENILFSQYFIKCVKDFINLGDQIICTSFANNLYLFPMDDDVSFVKQDVNTEYCAAEKVFSNSECLYKIMEEVEKNKELTKKINNEGNYLAALTLSKRQDVMDNIINHSIKVYESYEDVIRENSVITLTESMQEYFKPNTYQILVKITTGHLQHVLNNILSNLLNDVKIHITFSSDNKLIKTTSIKVSETFKKFNILLPFNIKDENVSEVNANIKLVSSIPGAFDEKQKLWVTLYRKDVVLKSEHFVEPNSGTKSCLHLKELSEPLVDSIHKLATTQYGSLFTITDTSKYHINAIEFSVYGKLPNNYKDILKNETLIARLEYLNKRKATYILNQLKSEEFLRSETNLCFKVANSNVKLEIVNEHFSNSVIKVTSMDMLAAFNIRNLVMSLIYNDATFGDNDNANIKYTLYNISENILKDTKIALLNQHRHEDFQAIAENFERNVFGALPI